MRIKQELNLKVALFLILTYSTNGSTLDFDSSNVGSSPARLTK